MGFTIESDAFNTVYHFVIVFLTSKLKHGLFNFFTTQHLFLVLETSAFNLSKVSCILYNVFTKWDIKRRHCFTCWFRQRHMSTGYSQVCLSTYWMLFSSKLNFWSSRTKRIGRVCVKFSKRDHWVNLQNKTSCFN